MTASTLKILLEGHYHKTLTPQQQQELQKLIGYPENEEAIKLLLDELTGWDAEETTEQLPEETSFAILQTILDTRNQPAKLVKMTPFRKTIRWGAAAIITFLTGSGIYFLIKNDHQYNTESKTIAAGDVAPGKTGAVLILADGSSITLDSHKDGFITRQGNSGITLQHGQLTYDKKNTGTETSPEKQATNTLRTPKGRQFKLVLPDGSQIWLNAASSVTFPTAFTGKVREVLVSGEVFFEVKGDPARPFIVNTENNTRIQVLGTSFNVNTYTDEPDIKTTLLDGSIKVTSGEAEVILRPGEQALQPAGHPNTLRLLRNTDTEDVTAWKNGLFSLKRTDINTLMRQLSRWYDIEVEVREENKFSSVLFGGSVSRDVPLSNLLKAFKVYGINSRMEQNKLIIYP